MMSKSLQTIGALALAIWTCAGAFMWMEVKNHVTVNVQEGSPEQSDETALLAEQMTTLSSDLDALTASLEHNFGLVAEAIGSGATESEVRSAVIEERLSQVEQALPQAMNARETAGALSTALAQMQAMQTLAAKPEALSPEPPELGQAAPTIKEPEPAQIVDDPTVADEQAQLDHPQQSAPAPSKRSFLAFDLPSRDFKFAGPQSFEILGDLSRVGFDAKSTLHDFSGVSNLVSGDFRVDLAQPGKGISGSVKIATNSLSTGLEGRDEAMLEHLGSQAHPKIEFVFESFKASAIDAKAKKLEGTISGQMTINGTTRAISMPVKAHIDASRRLVVEGEAPLSRADYKVDVPDKLGVLSTADEVRIWIHLRSRAKPEKGQ